MSEDQKTPVTSVFDMVSKIQRIIFYGILFVIPWFVVPLPYDSTEKIKSILFIILSALLILLEVIKWIWDGKISVTKSPIDKVFLLLFISFLLATVFARDTWMSFWGYDGRMGTGLLVMIFLFLFFFLSRGFLQKKEQIVNAVSSLSIGLFVLIVVSILSMLKVDIFSWLPYVKEFFVVGLPLTFSFQEIMLICGVSIFLNLFVLIDALRTEKYQSMIFPIVALAISFISLPIFSVSQGILVPVLFFVVTILASMLLWIKLEKGLKTIPVIIAIFALLSVGFSVGLQYESFTKSVLGESFSTVTPIRLGADISWVVASSSIVKDFFRGLIGLGNDSFGIAYNLYRPATDATIVLGNTTFVAGSNELFTTLANRGLIGVTVWLLLGLAYLRLMIRQIASAKGEKGTASILLGLTSMFIFLGSLFLPFSFLTFFLLFVSTILLIVFDNREENNEEFLLKFWAVNTGTVSRDINKTMESINWFFTILMTVLVVSGIILLSVKTVSTAYVVRAEAYNAEMNQKYQDEEDISIDVREKYLERMAAYYDKALRYDSSDLYVNRKSSLISLEIINLLGERYAKADEEDKDALLSSITTWKNTAIDLSREAIDTSPLTYANWNTRASVYIGLIGVGFTDYGQDALDALQTCVLINPLDYDSYYKAGQIYMVQEEYDKALNTFNTVLNINGQHVPSLILSASILYEKKDVENAAVYLKAAKEILEVNKLEKSETYQNILKSLEELGVDEKKVEELEDIDDKIDDEKTTESTPSQETQPSNLEETQD